MHEQHRSITTAQASDPYGTAFRGVPDRIVNQVPEHLGTEFWSAVDAQTRHSA